MDFREMYCRFVRAQGLKHVIIILMLLGAMTARGQPAAPRPGEFPPGTLNRIAELPASRLRTRIEGLAPAAQQRALEWLRSFHFTALDLKTLQADEEGGIFYADEFSLDPAPAQGPSEPVVAEAALPVNPFPASLIFHSKPGAPNVLFLNFTGENVTGTAWNTSLGRSSIPAVAFSTDSDYATFSDAEQLAITRMWQRVAEDYAPFNIDVTTERPAVFGTRTAHALITRNTDGEGRPNPSSSSGGIAYVNVFGGSSYASYRPAWIYFNNFGNNESYIAEAASHEVGHNLGLSHDGRTDGVSYYGGHGSGDTSWGPIMGTAYNRNVSQWSKGEYYLANNTQDDLAIVTDKISYRTDDHGDAFSTAETLVITGGTNVVSTTPETDLTNANTANKGVIARNTDVDVFSFTTGTGPVNLTVRPWTMASGARGGNLDILLELYDANGTLLLINNAAAQTYARIQTNLNWGTYYVSVRNTGVGDPFSSAPIGYTSYGSVGQYFISGYVAPASAGSSLVQLIATVNNPVWGSVTPTNTASTPGSIAQVMATPANYYRFVGWTNGITATNNPLTLVLTTNASIQAIFAEMLTTTYPTPYWWLASCGYTANFENAVTAIGLNGMPLWQSYVAGLNPNVANSQLRLSLTRSAPGTGDVLNWNTAMGRVYSLWWSTNLARGFTPLSGAANLPSTVQSFTNRTNPLLPTRFYRIEVRKL